MPSYTSVPGYGYTIPKDEQPPAPNQLQIDTCDLNRVRLKHLDGSDLTVTEYDKIHRFIRLWRKMGWSIDETDKSLVALTADKTTYTLGYKDECDLKLIQMDLQRSHPV